MVGLWICLSDINFISIFCKGTCLTVVHISAGQLGLCSIKKKKKKIAEVEVRPVRNIATAFLL